MHVVAPTTYTQRPQPKTKRRWPVVLLLALVAVAAANYLRPLPAATASLTLPNLAPQSQPSVSWPTSGQSAIGAAGYGILAINGAQTPLATASIAKVITALCVLDKLPLTIGQSGPTYTLDAADVAVYNQYVSQGGSVMAVTDGEQLTEYQALEALLIPSANNIADSLVYKVFGSQSAYSQYASTYLTTHGLNNTHIGSDASGFDPSTISTASDLTLLGQLAQTNPVLMSIAGMRQVTLPVVGTVDNYNTALGVNGIDGIKTGNNDANPGALLFSANIPVGDSAIAVDGTVMGAANLQSAISAAARLAQSMQAGFVQDTAAGQGQRLGIVTTAWGSSAPIVSANQIQLVHWRASRLYETHSVQAGLQAGAIGRLTIASGKATASTPLLLQHDIAGPSFIWRLTRH